MSSTQFFAQHVLQIPGAKDATTYFGEGEQFGYHVLPGRFMPLYVGFYTYPCSKPPSVSLLFSGRAFTISKEDFNLGRVDADSPWVSEILQILSSPLSEYPRDCVGGILGLGEGFDPSLAIIGEFRPDLKIVCRHSILTIIGDELLKSCEYIYVTFQAIHGH